MPASKQCLDLVASTWLSGPCPPSYLQACASPGFSPTHACLCQGGTWLLFAQEGAQSEAEIRRIVNEAKRRLQDSGSEVDDGEDYYDDAVNAD
jgi:hypothetical protein